MKLMRTRSLAANEVQTSARFESNSLSRLWGEGGQRPGEGAEANGSMSLGGLGLLATSGFVIRISLVIRT
jgi:hypothetical protein